MGVAVEHTGVPQFRRKMALSKLSLRCPPLPETVFEALRLRDNPKLIDTHAVVAMVQRDPVVAAHLLHLVNSAYYGLRCAVSSVERAVILLGPLRTTEIIATSNMSKLRTLFDGPAAVCFAKLIRHSIATAFLTRYITSGNPRQSGRNDISFTAGLIHDLGKISFIYNYPEESASLYGQVSSYCGPATVDLLALERRTFGYDHLEAGEYIARKFSFPRELISVIVNHQDLLKPDSSHGREPLLLAVGAANLCAKALGFGFEQRVSMAACARSPLWEQTAGAFKKSFQNGTHLFESLIAQQVHVKSHVEILTYSTSHFLAS